MGKGKESDVYRTTKAQFTYFKTRCEYWLKHLGIDYTAVDYKWEKLEKYDGAANSGNSMAEATITLDTEWSTNVSELRQNPLRELDKTAKHECIHVLLKRLLVNARARFVNEAEVDEAEEELCRRLEKLIP